MKQLSLPFVEEQDFAPEDFCPAPSNAQAREWLARPDAWSNGRLVLWGEAGCGKTHLLHLWAKANGATIVEGARLQGLIRPTGPVAVDDAELVPEPRALLHLLNAAAEAGFPVLMASRLPPMRMSYKLADLTSRLRAAQSVEIMPPEDELLEMLLSRLCAARQLQLSVPVRNLLLLYLPRAPAYYREAVARLDRAALDKGARITRVLVMEILEGLAEDE
ncbi:P-loop NTPase family protein [Acidocella aromatica]|uniref:Chromosomal replication initiation ATPase DnaA n=1 Tax=Acidocella aromatica TaxID=1303579 RepID=A0A840VRY8_9PROT|nr:DNA replication protein [Acidocella aromatica]MBB5374100.1 chromosomal replication initiation ATPase DnaA [Acidocella aromatica]